MVLGAGFFAVQPYCIWGQLLRIRPTFITFLARCLTFGINCSVTYGVYCYVLGQLLSHLGPVVTFGGSSVLHVEQTKIMKNVNCQLRQLLRSPTSTLIAASKAGHRL